MYRRLCVIAASLTLLLAFFSKYYDGRYQRFSEAYLGDVFIVMCLYFCSAFVSPSLSILKKALLIAVVSISVELFQGTGLPAVLNLPEPFVFILGASFDAKDFIFYALGLGAAALVDGSILKWLKKKYAKF